MSILNWFENKQKQKIESKKLNLPGNLWIKCSKCSEILFKKDLENNLMVCPNCNKHYRISPKIRLKHFLDPNTFKEINKDIEALNFLNFTDTDKYENKIEKSKLKTKCNEAIITGRGKINSKPINLGIMNFDFLGGSMGSVVGEKITRLIDDAIEKRNPVILFTASGGARMQEGIVSLMQMAKTSAALANLSNHKLPYISVLCDPTTGGTSASFAMLGDINIAEPDALISFAGPRVIEQTIKQKLPKEFQRSEFLLEHGVIDLIVERSKMKNMISNLLDVLDETTI